MATPKHILITWDSVQHGFNVTLRAINLLVSQEGISVTEVIYLMGQDLSEQSHQEIQYYNTERKNNLKRQKTNLSQTEEIVSELKEKNTLPQLLQKRIHLVSPTHYESIYSGVRKVIEELTAEQEAEKYILHINASPGTPQMHVVWLMLNAGGHLPPETKLWSTQFNREKDTTELSEIRFKPKTYLNEIFEASFHRGKIEDKTFQLNENSPRLKAQKKLETYFTIPNAPILILGERGTGKSTLARDLLSQFPGTFKELICGTLSPELIRAELFGYKKGAFTGADKDKEGIMGTFHNGGTLFLDEIQDLSKDNQRLLLQVLQTGEYYPIGSTKPEKANFRLICASNNQLSELVTNQKIDTDFFDRISRFIVEIPPIRQCPLDMEAFWKTTWNAVSNFATAPAMPEASLIIPELLKLPLSGNFRDLERIASLILANLVQKKSPKESTTQAINEFNYFESLKTTPNKSTFPYSVDKTYQEMLSQFRLNLFEWAKKAYPTTTEAIRKLDIATATFYSFAKQMK